MFWGEQPPFASIGCGGRYFFGVSRKRSTLNAQHPTFNSAECGRISGPVAFTLIALIIAALVLIIFVRIETWPARTAKQTAGELERIGKQVRAAFIDIAHLQPRVTINNRIYLEQTTP